jgi:hypothetical protein
VQAKEEAAAKIQAIARGREARRASQRGDLDKFVDPSRKVNQAHPRMRSALHAESQNRRAPTAHLHITLHVCRTAGFLFSRIDPNCRLQEKIDKAKEAKAKTPGQAAPRTTGTKANKHKGLGDADGANARLRSTAPRAPANRLNSVNRRARADDTLRTGAGRTSCLRACVAYVRPADEFQKFLMSKDKEVLNKNAVKIQARYKGTIRLVFSE